MEEDQLEELLSGLATKHKSAMDQISADVNKKHEDIIKILKKQGEDLTALGEAGNGGTRSKSLEVILKEKGADIAHVINGDKRSIKIDLSANEVKALVTRDSVTDSTQAMRLNEVGQIATPRTRMRDIFRKGKVSANSNGVIRYFDQETVTRGADTRLEGVQKPESAITWVEKLLKIEKIADSIPLTMESLKDVDFIESETRRLLTTNLQLKEDQQLYKGDGTSPNLKGVLESAPEFTSYSGPGVPNANIFDLIAVLRAEIMNGKDAKYSPTVVLMNPIDLVSYKLEKGEDGHYVLPGFLIGNDNTLAGVTIIESAQVDADTLLIGDFNYATIYDLEGVTLMLGFIDKQFIENKITLLAEKRLGLLVREVDEDGFLKVTSIEAALALIEPAE